MKDSPPEESSCALPGDQLSKRLQEFRGLLQRTLVSRSREGDSFIWVLRSTPEIESEVEQLAAKELLCCSFFAFDIRSEAGYLHWRVTAPSSQREMLDVLYRIADG